MSQAVAAARAAEFRTDVPARLDRLPWSAWHGKVILALGVTWIIDGLEVTLVGAVSPILERKETLGLSSTQNGLLNTAYLLGAVIGALVFGYLTDRCGRKKLFTITLGLYLVAAFLTAFSWNFWSFAVFRFFTGAGIGGEYSAINSAIDEMIPARVRGHVDLAINGTFWVGAAIGSLATLVLLDAHVFPINLGWRLGFAIGAVLGLIVVLFRRFVPESPRWLMTHGYKKEAERVVGQIEREVERGAGGVPLPRAHGTITVRPHGPIGFRAIARTMLRTYPRRTVLGLSMILSQAFLYNGVSFSFALILAKFYRVAEDHVGLYLLPVALGNFAGPLLLGRLFDTMGRKPMIITTYVLSALLLVLSGALFARGVLSARSQTVLWALAFFFASSGASAAYLTVSEIFPLELRGMAIALFYSTGTGIGGPLASWLFGALIDKSKPIVEAGRLVRAARPLYILYGDLLAAGILLAAAVVVAFFGVRAERTALEEVAQPLSAAHGD
jgi:MFS family permease